MTFGTAIDGIIARRSGAWARPSWWNLLIVLPWTIGLLVMMNEWRVDRQIAGRQRTASGVITAHEPANHNQYRYEFEVDGKSYTGLEGPKGREFDIGKTVVVYYDPENPSKNALTDFHDLELESVGPVPAILIGIGTVVAFIFYARRGARNGTP